jgi:ABC-type polysaccharide/polyol phosphate export permease
LTVGVDRLARQHRPWAIVTGLAREELLQRYAGSAIGALWVILQPLLLVLTYWFVFSLSLRMRVDGPVPFLLTFVAGFTPWLTFQEVITRSAVSVTGNPHLVKRIVFPVELLPLVHLCAALVSHAVMLVILVVLLVIDGRPLTVRMIELPYYALALSVLALAFGWFVAAVNVFVRDTSHALTSLLGVWFWLTPIVWPVSAVPSAYRGLIDLNPFWYVVVGYRSALLGGEPVWTDPTAALRFWLIALPCLAAGLLTFRRLRHDFADLL